MNNSPIVLSVKRKAFRSDSPHAAPSNEYIAARKRKLADDNNTCCFCGFRSATNEVHHLNDDHNDNRLTNLATACVLCHMCFHISFAGIKGRGKLIYLPDTDISQADLNQIIRQLWIASYLCTGDMKDYAVQLLERFDKAEVYSNKAIGTANPTVLGDYLANLSEKEYAKRGFVLKGVYLLPLKPAYEKHIQTWIKEGKNFTPEDWVSVARQRFKEWGGLE